MDKCLRAKSALRGMLGLRGIGIRQEGDSSNPVK
jgi:hypothetical protein